MAESIRSLAGEQEDLCSVSRNVARSTPMIDTILLDVDGVSNTFHKHVFDYLGVPYSDDSHYPVECGWDIVDAANRLAGYERFTPATFGTRSPARYGPASRSRPSSRLSLPGPRFRWARENIHFLTEPTLSPDCLAGKLEWIQRHAPKWMQRQFLIGPSKHLCAKPGVVADRRRRQECHRLPGAWRHGDPGATAVELAARL